jgi:serine protease AprX
MDIAQRTGLRPLLPPGGFRALWSVVSFLAIGVLLTAAPATADSHKAHLSNDLDAVVHGRVAAPTDGIDVIVSGAPDFVARTAARHQARVKRSMASGAVLTVSPAQLLAMADDQQLGAISGDLTMRSELALVTEVTGAAAAWHGQIRRLGAVTGRGVTVAIIDSGVDAHTALAYRILASVDLTRPSGGVVSSASTDANGHGTHVAGIVAAGVPAHDTGTAPVGMAPDANIVSVKVLEKDGSGKASAVIAGIDWVIANKAKYGIRIINLSLGATPTQSWRFDPVCQAVERAVRSGIVVVASAGNRGETLDHRQVLGAVTTPGISPYAITVGALRTNNTVDPSDDVVAPWSSKGPTYIDHLIKPDLVAPGSRVVSLLSPGSTLARDFPERHVFGSGRNGYFQLSGTSMAAAAVSGAAALVLQSQPQLNPLQVKLLLQGASDFSESAGLVGGGAGSLHLSALNSDGLLVEPSALGSAIGSDVTVWGQVIVWGDGIAHVIVWGEAAVQGDVIVWGDFNPSDVIVWGEGGGDVIVWGEASRDVIVWGEGGRDVIVWGEGGDVIVWGEGAGDVIVWGEAVD